MQRKDKIIPQMQNSQNLEISYSGTLYRWAKPHLFIQIHSTITKYSNISEEEFSSKISFPQHQSANITSLFQSREDRI